MAKQIYKYLLKNDYTDESDQIAEAYHAAKKDQKLAALPEELAPHAEQVFLLIDSVFSTSQLPQIGDDRKPKTNPLNSNFEKKEFQELWGRINRKAVFLHDRPLNNQIGIALRLERELHSIGIMTMADLLCAGAVEAYRALQK